MEFFFFIVVAMIFFSSFGKRKKQKNNPNTSLFISPKKATPVLSPKSVIQPFQPSNINHKSGWENYEAAERNEQAGMQDDLYPTEFYKVSKDRLNLARKAAAGKLSDSLQSFETTAKNARPSGAYVTKQPPLVRDMNLSRKLFLSGGSRNIFGERQKKSFGIKTILGVVGLTVIGLYMLGA